MNDHPEAFLGLLAILAVALIIVLVIASHVRWKKKRDRMLGLLNDSEEYDIVELWYYRFVLPKATGQSITHINAEVRNLTDKRLRVVVRPGTYFVARGNHQSMVTSQEHRFRLGPSRTEQIYVPAACINAALPIPSTSDRFHGVAKVSTNLTRFLEEARGEEAMVIQAGVWALTDNYSKYDIQQRLIARTYDGRSRPAISDAQVARAKEILKRLAIPNRL